MKLFSLKRKGAKAIHVVPPPPIPEAAAAPPVATLRDAAIRESGTESDVLRFILHQQDNYIKRLERRIEQIEYVTAHIDSEVVEITRTVHTIQMRSSAS